MEMERSSVMNRTSFSAAKSWFPIVLAVLCILITLLGLYFLESTLSADTSTGVSIWGARILILLGVIGAVAGFLIMCSSGRNSNSTNEQVIAMGTSLADVDTPALASGLSALTTGDLTRRAIISTAEFDLGSSGNRNQSLQKSMNAILGSLRECARSYNWITDEPCKRMFYKGTDSFQEGLSAGDAMGNIVGDRAKILLSSALHQDNLKLRINGFNTSLATNFPGVKVVRILDSSGLNEDQIIAEIQSVMEQHPDLAGFYGTDIESFMPMVKYIKNKKLQGKIKVVTHDLSDEIARQIQDGLITVSVCQNPFAQGYDTVIHLYNHLVSGWVPPVERLLITPDIVNRENLEKYWKIGQGAFQSEEAIAHRPIAQPNLK